MEATGDTWIGMFDQPELGKYPVMLTIQDWIRVDYPSLGCGGFLTVERVDETAAYLRERITYGVGKCMDGVEVRIMRGDTLLKFDVFLPDGSSGGEGWLTRVPVTPPGE